MPPKRKPLSQLSTSSNLNPNKKQKLSTINDEILQAGTIVQMTLKNFMCHSELVVTFRNNSTIIVGKNGSGKSSILTALIVGLGGKAVLTDRGSSVKGFIKAGERSGSVEIVLRNSGYRAYKPQIFGQEICVIRTISQSSSSYRIKSETGQTIATTVQELQNILRHLNIQIDNPVCVLNQDTSRNFLSTNNPHHKFTLFKRATGLDTLAENFNNAKEKKRICDDVLKEKQEIYKKIEEEINNLKIKMDNHKKLSTYRNKRCILNAELVWSEVKNLENELHTLEESVENYQENVNKLKSKLDNRGEKMDLLNKKIDELQLKFTELKDTINIQIQAQNDLKHKRNDLNQILETKTREKRNLLSNIESYNNDVQQLRNEIANSNENKIKIEQQKIDRLNQLKYLHEQLKLQDEQVDTCKNDYYQYNMDVDKREDELQNLRAEINQLNSKIMSEQKRLNELEKDSYNNLSIYGRDMINVKEMIKNNCRKFKHEPRGPIGSYIKLKDQKWAVAIEGYLTPSFLKSFIVDNANDAKLLKEIFRKCIQNHPPSIITCKFLFKKHNVSNNIITGAPQDCRCIYNAIEIDDVIVSNCTVDQYSIENILLIPNDKRAIQLMSYKQNVPRNCHSSLTIAGDRYFPDPNYKTYATRYHRAQYLQADKTGFISQLKANINEFTKQKQNIANQMLEFSKMLNSKKDQRNELENKLKTLHTNRKTINSQLNALTSTAEPEIQDVETLEQELKSLEKLIETNQSNLNEINQTIDEIKLKMNENKEQLQQVRTIVNELENRLHTIEDELNNKKSERLQITNNSDYDTNKLKHIELKLNNAKKDVENKLNDIDLYVKEAQKSGKRPDIIRSSYDINQEIEKLNRVIGCIESDTENLDKLTDRCKELNERQDQFRDILNKLKVSLKLLKNALTERDRDYKQTEHICITNMQHAFKKILALRQFNGEIEIDVNNKKLNLIVIPQSGSQSITNVTNLSGGERSFSTVAFLYALWRCMNFPFYFLDEFDVYMDKLNRTKVIKVLLDQAVQRPHLQYVFLTPQDVSFVPENVDILRLEDPKRIED